MFLYNRRLIHPCVGIRQHFLLPLQYSATWHKKRVSAHSFTVNTVVKLIVDTVVHQIKKILADQISGGRLQETHTASPPHLLDAKYAIFYFDCSDMHCPCSITSTNRLDRSLEIFVKEFYCAS